MKTFLKHFSKALAIGYVVFAGPSLLAADLNVGRSFFERPLRVPSSFTTKEKAPERGAGSFWGLPEDAIVLILILLAIVAISAVMYLVNMARGGSGLLGLWSGKIGFVGITRTGWPSVRSVRMSVGCAVNRRMRHGMTPFAGGM